METRQMRVGISIASCCLVTATLAPPSHPIAAEEKTKRPGFTDTTQVILTILDVEVTDRAGNPIHGLTQGDFTARLDGQLWPIYSVDDLCGCIPEPSTGAVAPTSHLAAPSEIRHPATAVDEPVRFILF